MVLTTSMHTCIYIMFIGMFLWVVIHHADVCVVSLQPVLGQIVTLYIMIVIHHAHSTSPYANQARQKKCFLVCTQAQVFRGRLVRTGNSMVFNAWLKILEALQLSIDQETRRWVELGIKRGCLLYTSPSPRDATLSRMPSSA